VKYSSSFHFVLFVGLGFKLLSFIPFSNMAQVVIDNPSPQFVYGGGSWSTNALSHYFGGSIAWPGFAQAFGSNADTGVYGALTFYFQGMSLSSP
jgi:hypothetical protein